MKKLIFLLTAINIVTFGQVHPKIGIKAPDVPFQKIVNYGKPSASLSDFNGKVVILDFWATWCGPCISSFPKLETLQAKFGNQLQILTITDDPEERITRFLSKRKLSLPIVLDNNRSIASSFPHRSIPHLVIIDKNGLVSAITSSSGITEEIVQKVIDGERIDLKEKKDVMDYNENDPLSGNGNFSYQVTFTPFKDGYPSYSNSQGLDPYLGRRIVAVNLSPATLFEIAFQFPPRIRTSIEVKEPSRLKWNKQNAVCFDLILPEDLGERRFEIMKAQLMTYFPYTARIEQRERAVKVLSLRENDIRIKDSSPDTPSFSSYSGKGLSAKAQSIETLRDFLENMLNVPVIDNTPLKGKYDFEIPWYNESPNQIYEELKKLGLQLTDSTKNIDILVIKD
jgi:uncharacterized protein (TIGR03435 family)